MQAFFLRDNTGGISQSSIIDREEERFYWEVQLGYIEMPLNGLQEMNDKENTG